MATRKKEAVMSENRLEDGEVNGESTNALPSYTLSAVHDDYDIVVNPDSMTPTFFTNLCKMAERTYKHIMSNEALASKGYKDAGDDETLQQSALRAWRNARRELIVNGELGFRETGPRISEEDKQWRQDVIDILLKPRWTENKPFPTSGKAMINDRSLNDWIEYCQASPKYANIKEQAFAKVAERKAQAAQQKASNVSFADL